MKVLFLYNESELEGKGNIDLFSITKKLEERGHKIIILLQKDKNPNRKKNIYPIIPKPIKGFIMMPITLLRLLRIVSNEKPDVIISEAGWYFPLLLYVFSAFNKTPFVFNFRGLVLETLVEWKSKPLIFLWVCKIFIKINNFVYRHNKHVIGTNDSICKYYEEILKIPVPLIGTHAIDLNLFRPLTEEERNNVKKKFGISPELISILYSGAHEKWHVEPIKILCDVAKNLSMKYPIQLIIGGWGKEKNTIKNYMESNDMMKFSIILPWLDHSDVLKIVASCDICVDPLIRAFPMNRPPPGKLIEYMSCGKCIITTRCINNEEMIKHQKNGLLFSGEKKDLENKLQFLLDNPQLVEVYGREARQTIEIKHYNENKVENLEKYLLSMVLCKAKLK